MLKRYRCVSISRMAGFPKKCPTCRNPSWTKQETRKDKKKLKKCFYVLVIHQYQKNSTTILQVHLNKPDGLAAKNLSGLSKSNLNEIRKRNLETNLINTIVITGMLGSSMRAFRFDVSTKKILGTCMLWWCKHVLTSYMTRIRIVPILHTFVSLASFDPRPSGV